MKNLTLKLAIFLMVLPALTSLAQKSVTNQSDDINTPIIAALSAGNAVELSRYFNSMVDLGIAGNEDTYSQTQATRIVQDFFNKNKVKSMKINKQGTSNDGSKFSIGEMNAGGKVFRVYYLLKKVSGQFLIQQLQIQEEA